MLSITSYIEEGRRTNIALATATGGIGPIGGKTGELYAKKNAELIRQMAGGKPWNELSSIEKKAIKEKFKQKYNEAYTRGTLPVIGWISNYEQARNYYKNLDKYKEIKKGKRQRLSQKEMMKYFK